MANGILGGIGAVLGYASGEDTGEISGGQHSVIAVNQSFVAVIKSVNFQFFQISAEPFYHAAHGGI